MLIECVQFTDTTLIDVLMRLVCPKGKNVFPLANPLFPFLCTAIDNDDGGADTLERLRNITRMFAAKGQEDDEPQPAKRIEKSAPGDKFKNRFQK
jgi:hypothetical protein